MSEWQPIETAPKDGSWFWGNDADDAISMRWHETFSAFVSAWRRMEMAPGYLINDKPFEDHSPVIHSPTYWMAAIPIPAPTKEAAE